MYSRPVHLSLANPKFGTVGFHEKKGSRLLGLPSPSAPACWAHSTLGSTPGIARRNGKPKTTSNLQRLGDELRVAPHGRVEPGQRREAEAQRGGPHHAVDDGEAREEPRQGHRAVGGLRAAQRPQVPPQAEEGVGDRRLVGRGVGQHGFRTGRLVEGG